MLGPALGLGIMAIFSFVKIISHLKVILSISFAEWSDYLFEVISDSRVPIIISVMFYLYVHTINIIGFFLSTFIFTSILLSLSRLLNRFWLLITFLVTLFILFIFRGAIGLWMEDVWLYQFLPPYLSEFANKYL